MNIACLFAKVGIKMRNFCDLRVMLNKREINFRASQTSRLASFLS
uniref:Uncharacterized protein n=1 Tax=Anguilla anguilla TaxID=7936 RepID=A0A0E9RPT9_ANGAN